MSTTDLPCATSVFPYEYKVRVIFKGFIVARIENGAPEAMVGALAPSISSCHQPKIQIFKLNPSGGLDGTIEVLRPDLRLNDDFSVMVFPTPPEGVQKYQADCNTFNRFDERHNDRHDFRWFGNLTEMHGIQVTVDETKLRPQFKMNAGIFHTSTRSDGEAMITTPHNTSKPPTHFGRFAQEITARVPLANGSNAILLNGTRQLAPPIFWNSDFRYDIIYDCHCYIDDDEEESDFGLVYPQVITNIGWTDQISFLSEDYSQPAGKLQPTIRVFNPEVYCNGGSYP